MPSRKTFSARPPVHRTARPPRVSGQPKLPTRGRSAVPGHAQPKKIKITESTSRHVKFSSRNSRHQSVAQVVPQHVRSAGANHGKPQRVLHQQMKHRVTNNLTVNNKVSPWERNRKGAKPGHTGKNAQQAAGGEDRYVANEEYYANDHQLANHAYRSHPPEEGATGKGKARDTKKGRGATRQPIRINHSTKSSNCCVTM
jgi:hypothetical protein